MNFDLHLYGETPEELLNVLAHLGHMDSNYHTPIPGERHPAQAPAPQLQSEPVAQLDKPKAQTSTKQKKTTQKPEAAPAEEPANPTSWASSSAHHAGAECSAVAGTAAETPSGSGTTARTETPATTASSEPDPASLDKIRDLARSLIVHGKRTEVQQIIKATGATSISKLPPESYTTVCGELLKLKDEVDADASN